MVRLKKDIAWEELNKFGVFHERSVISGIDNIPDNMRWWGYWKNVPPHGFVEFIEVNMGTREIRTYGCLEEFAEMVLAGIIEIEEDLPPETWIGSTSEGGFRID